MSNIKEIIIKFFKSGKLVMINNVILIIINLILIFAQQ